MPLDLILFSVLGLGTLATVVHTLRVVARDGYRRQPTDPNRLP